MRPGLSYVVLNAEHESVKRLFLSSRVFEISSKKGLLVIFGASCPDDFMIINYYSKKTSLL